MIRDALDEILDYINRDPGRRNQEELHTALMNFGFYILLFALLMGVFMFMMRQTIIVMSRLIEYDLRKQIFQHYLSLDTSFYKKNKTGDLMSRIVEDVNKVRMYLGPVMLYGFNLISLVVIVIFTMFQVNVKLSVFTLIPLPFLSYIIYIVSNKINKKSESIQRQLANLTTVSQESFSGIRIIKSYATESFWKEDFKTNAAEYKENYMGLARIDAMFFPTMLLLIGLSTLITLYVGGLNVYNGTVTPGNIAEFIIYVTMLTWPVSALGWCASIIQQAEASQKRINDFLNIKSEIIDQGKIKMDTRIDQLEFKNVHFTYPDSGTHALNGISFRFRAGEKIGIVGKTASGKSTLAELMLRMYNPTKGKILINGRDIQEYELEPLRNCFAYVPQDTFLFSDKIVDNIRFGSETITEDTAKEKAKQAQVHEEIMALPEAYNSILGERGVNLSGGQKQRISLARALAKPATVYLFDDCLSAVDSQTEENIMDQLKEHFNDSTMIFITQKIKLTSQLDRIIVLSEGKIIQEGTFEELLEEDGLFRQLYYIENQSNS